MMTQKYYKSFASFLKDYYIYCYYLEQKGKCFTLKDFKDLIRAFSIYFKNDNPKFEISKFEDTIYQDVG